MILLLTISGAISGESFLLKILLSWKNSVSLDVPATVAFWVSWAGFLNYDLQQVT